MSSSGLTPQQLHPCTVYTSDGIRCPLSCFAHDIMWQARQLVHAGDHSVSSMSLKRLDAEKLEEEINTLPVDAFPTLGHCGF